MLIFVTSSQYQASIDVSILPKSNIRVIPNNNQVGQIALGYLVFFSNDGYNVWIWLASHVFVADQPIACFVRQRCFDWGNEGAIARDPDAGFADLKFVLVCHDPLLTFPYV